MSKLWYLSKTAVYVLQLEMFLQTKVDIWLEIVVKIIE